jgi:hypothetical protein
MSTSSVICVPSANCATCNYRFLFCVASLALSYPPLSSSMPLVWCKSNLFVWDFGILYTEVCGPNTLNDTSFHSHLHDILPSLVCMAGSALQYVSHPCYTLQNDLFSLTFPYSPALIRWCNLEVSLPFTYVSFSEYFWCWLTFCAKVLLHKSCVQHFVSFLLQPANKFLMLNLLTRLCWGCCIAHWCMLRCVFGIAYLPFTNNFYV